jgi:hypothetical protein
MKRSQIHLFIAITLFFIATNTMAQVANSQAFEKRKSDIVLYSITGISFLNFSNLDGCAE